MPLTTILGLLGCGLLCLALAVAVLRLRRRPVRVRYAVTLSAAVLVFAPLGDLSTAGYVRGLTGDLSVATLALAADACFGAFLGKPLFERRDVDALLGAAAAAGLFLYPFALGWTPFDPYALGYNSIVFITVLLLLSVTAWRARWTLVVLVVLLGALAFLGGVYESRNLWDYLIDPLVVLYALFALPARLVRRYFSRDASARA
ncbi:MAG TPA: hypothetical protein VMI74_08005 [Burkholderiales bacterium]|nr:hypothetical protein [Burkholderiales bacterium]